MALYRKGTSFFLGEDGIVAAFRRKTFYYLQAKIVFEEGKKQSSDRERINRLNIFRISFKKRKLGYEFAKPLSITFEKVCHSGEDPTDWKSGNITPFLKREKGKTQSTTGQ